jgi:hypothetical protein
MLLRKTVAVYCENHMERINTLREQNAELLTLKHAVYIVTALLK